MQNSEVCLPKMHKLPDIYRTLEIAASERRKNKNTTSVTGNAYVVSSLSHNAKNRLHAFINPFMQQRKNLFHLPIRLPIYLHITSPIHALIHPLTFPGCG